MMEGQWLFGVGEKNDSDSGTSSKRDKDTLLKLIQNWVRPGSIIVSDCWKAYYDIPKLLEYYKHFTVNHS